MDFFSIAPFKQHQANHTIKFVRKVVHGLNALQSQKITKQNTPKLGKNGKKKKLQKIPVQKEVRTQNT